MKIGKATPRAYGHNEYPIEVDGVVIGTVTGGGSRRSAGASQWWSWQRSGGWTAESGRYCTTRREAIERLTAAYRKGGAK